MLLNRRNSAVCWHITKLWHNAVGRRLTDQRQQGVKGNGGEARRRYGKGAENRAQRMVLGEFGAVRERSSPVMRKWRARRGTLRELCMHGACKHMNHAYGGQTCDGTLPMSFDGGR